MFQSILLRPYSSSSPATERGKEEMLSRYRHTAPRAKPAENIHSGIGSGGYLNNKLSPVSKFIRITLLTKTMSEARRHAPPPPTTVPTRPSSSVPLGVTSTRPLKRQYIRRKNPGGQGQGRGGRRGRGRGGLEGLPPPPPPTSYILPHPPPPPNMCFCPYPNSLCPSAVTPTTTTFHVGGQDYYFYSYQRFQNFLSKFPQPDPNYITAATTTTTGIPAGYGHGHYDGSYGIPSSKRPLPPLLFNQDLILRPSPSPPPTTTTTNNNYYYNNIINHQTPFLNHTSKTSCQTFQNPPLQIKAHQLQQEQGPSSTPPPSPPTISSSPPTTPKPIRLVRSTVTVCAISTLRLHQKSSSWIAPPTINNNKQPSEIEAEIEAQLVPILITDSSHMVTFANSAYNKLIRQPEISWLQNSSSSISMAIGGTENILNQKTSTLTGKVSLLLDANSTSLPKHGFSCFVTIMWHNPDNNNNSNNNDNNNGRTFRNPTSITSMCDVTKLSCESNRYCFSWRFHADDLSPSATNF